MSNYSVISPAEERLQQAATERLMKIIQAEYGRTERQVLQNETVATITPDRRISTRIRLEMPFLLYPAARSPEGTLEKSGPPLQALAHDLSRGGIGFRCDQRCRSKFAIAEFDSMHHGPISWLIEICWCQRKGRRHYMAGASVLQLIEVGTPVAAS